jgi:hypothetical protein
MTISVCDRIIAISAGNIHKLVIDSKQIAVVKKRNPATSQAMPAFFDRLPVLPFIGPMPYADAKPVKCMRACMATSTVKNILSMCMLLYGTSGYFSFYNFPVDEIDKRDMLFFLQ